MADITNEQVHEVYSAWKEICDENSSLSKKDKIANRVAESTGMNLDSAKYYAEALMSMMNGETYGRTIKKYATGYYLERIYRDYGEEKLRDALDAVKGNFDDYYRLKRKDKLPGTRRIHAEYLKILKDGRNEYKYTDEIDENSTYLEGSLKTVTVNAYERNPKARAECIKEYGAICSVCDFNFENKYGKIGKDFIHVHHLKELASIGSEYEVDPIKDLRPVCPNCHAMLHKEKPAYSIKELQDIIVKKKKS